MTKELNAMFKKDKSNEFKRFFLPALIGAITLIVCGCTEGEPVSETPVISSNINIKNQNVASGVFGNDGFFC